jgi:hypothetical protein
MFQNLNKNTNQSISDSYSAVSLQIPPDTMREIVGSWFENFLGTNRKRKIGDKCVKFFIHRQMLLSKLYPYFEKPVDETLGNSILDYIDMTFAYRFFNSSKDSCALEKRVDNEFYFCLLAFALDRVEFPSLIQTKFKESYLRNNRSKVSLNRRNYLATTMFASRTLMNSVINSLINRNKALPTFDEIRRTCEKNMWHLRNLTSVENARSVNQLSKMKQDNSYRVYRGYEISPDQDVIINRKIRLQDANKSISFTTNRDVAQMFANYRSHDITDRSSTTYDDRITLAETMFEREIDSLKKNAQKKCIVSEYLVDEDDIIFFPMTTTITECEVFAIPDNARLTRYSIINSI